MAILLRDSSGCELAEGIQRTIAWKGRILMMLTCDRLPESVARCEQLGIHDYLVKPIGQWELSQALQSAAIRTIVVSRSPSNVDGFAGLCGLPFEYCQTVVKSR